MSILNSGGAKGADTQFGICAKAAGHEVRHYTFPNGHGHVEDVVVLTKEQLLQADTYLYRANSTLKRQFPSKNEFVNNLLRRNYWQVRDTKAVFAVAWLEKKEVAGGTAWAVQMAKDLRIPTIYLFDMLSNIWHQWFYSMNDWEYTTSLDIKKPREFSVYTGIGSRDLSVKGKEAIEELYK